MRRWRSLMKATSKFFIVDNPDGLSDGLIKSRNKETIGIANNYDAPDGMYIKCSLNKYWIISDEDYKKLKNK
jgi:hypothetical protein